MAEAEEGGYDGQASAGIGLDPHPIDFDSDFFGGKPLNAEGIAGGSRPRGAHSGDAARLRMAADRRARRGESGESGGPRGTGGADATVYILNPAKGFEVPARAQVTSQRA
jgi:hypothetical protein